jgi:hypothetical protein
MSLGRTRGVALQGIEGALVDVEADLVRGLPKVMFSGLPDAACRQAPDRIKAAAENSGVPIPNRRLTVNLSPASIPKVGSGWDLPIAIAVLAASEVFAAGVVDEIVHVGELGLDGSIRPVRGVLPVVLAAARMGMTQIVVPAANAAEAALVPGIAVVPARHRSSRSPSRQQRPMTSWSPTCATWSARTRGGWPWRSRLQADITCSSRDLRGPARRCWPSGCPRCCLILNPHRPWR